MHDKTVVASFNRLANASAAMRDLRAAGFAETDINLVASRAARDVASDAGDVVADTASGAATGAIAGGALGGAAGLAASLMGLAIPGIGPILAAGPIAAALAGAGAGAATGGLIGALVGAGIPEHRAKAYESGALSSSSGVSAAAMTASPLPHPRVASRSRSQVPASFVLHAAISGSTHGLS